MTGIQHSTSLMSISVYTHGGTPTDAIDDGNTDPTTDDDGFIWNDAKAGGAWDDVNTGDAWGHSSSLWE